MSIAGLFKRLVVGRPLTASEHDLNLTRIEEAVDGVAAAAAADATAKASASQAHAVQRGNHTGTQPIATVDGLEAALASKATPADINAAIAAVVDSAPDPLDTLNELATAVAGKVDLTDSRLGDAREWSAPTASQGEAETGTSTTRLAFTPQRVFQAVAAWWAGSAAKAKLDGIASEATANQSDSYLLSRANHTGTQTAETISDFSAAAAAAAPVQSVAGKAGTVTLSKADVGLGNVDNTADASKPVSTAQAAADAAVASAAAADAATKANAAQAYAIQRENHTGTQAISTVSGLQTALDSKQPAGSYAASSHGHAIGEVTGLQAALDAKAAPSDVTAAVAAVVDAAPAALDTLNELAAALGDDANFASTVTTALAGKAAAVHGHVIADVSGLQAALDGKAATSHAHVIANVTGLQDALDGKQAAGSYAAATHGHAIADVTGLQATLDGKQAAGSYAATVHTHGISDVTGLQTALDGKAATTHGHAIADVTGLQTALNGKQAAGSYAAASHGHAIADVAGLQSAIDGKQPTLPSGSEGNVLTYASGQWTAASPGTGSLPSANDGDVLTYASGSWIGSAPAYLPSSNQDGDVVTWSDSQNAWIAQQPSGGGGSGLPSSPADGSIAVYDADNATWTTGGNSMDLSEVVLASYGGGASDRAVVTFSPSNGGGPGFRSYQNGGLNYMEMNASGLTFPDNSEQTTAAIPLPAAMAAEGDVLTWSASSNAWVSLAPAAQVPTSASANDILSWNGSAWTNVMPSTPGLPSGSQGQALVFDGSNWVAGSPFPSASSGQFLYFDGSTWSGGDPLPGGASDGDVLTYSSSSQTWVAQAPSSGGGGGTAFAKSLMDESAMSLASSSYATVAVQGNSTYIVEGLAYLEVPGGANDAVMALRLSATTSDGNVWMDCDIAFDGQANNWVVGQDSNQSTLTVANNTDPMSNQTFPIRFRALVETNSWISSTNLAIHWGHSSSMYSIILKAGSWMVAKKLA